MLFMRVTAHDLLTCSHSFWKGISAAFFIALTILASCSSPDAHPLFPSYEELKQNGFYIYVLPESAMGQHHWSQSVSIWSWDHHCKSAGPSLIQNPISVVYSGQAEQPELSLRIGLGSAAWDHSRPATEIPLKTEWVMDGVARYYVSDGFVRLRFIDRFGIPVQVGSQLSIAEVVSLVDQIDYIGPPPETVENPWDYSKCQD